MRSCFSELVDVNMDVTPPPAGVLPAETTPPPLPEVVTKIVTDGVSRDDGAFAALVGAVVSATLLLLLLLCIAAVSLWCVSRHKGSYITNETDEDDDEEESLGSETETLRT